MALEQGLDVLVVFHGAGVEHEFVEAGREGGEDPENFLGVHSEDAVESPDGGRGPEGAGGEGGTLEISDAAGEPRREISAGPKRAIRSTPEPRSAGVADDFAQDPPHPRMQVEVVVTVNEAAGKPGFLERAPLLFEFLPDDPAVGCGQGQGHSGTHRRLTPGPLREGQRTGITEMQVPPKFESGSGPRQFDCLLRTLLSHHQARTREGSVPMGMEDRLVHRGVPAEVVGDKGQLQSLGHAPKGFPEIRRMAI